MLVNVHSAEGRTIISIADGNLIGKEFEDGDKYLQVPKQFYGGKELEEREILKLLKDASSVNVVGKESVEFCIKNKLVESDNILKVKDVPYAIIIFYDE